MKQSLKTKLMFAIIVGGLVPATIISWLSINASSVMDEEIAAGYEDVAGNVADKIDRNLFERYGDVQAFGANEAVNDRASWYQAGGDKNKIAAAANRYASLYGFYVLSYAVDLDGKVIAANDKDPTGKPIETAWLYQKSFKDAEWFKACLAGNFLKSDVLNGTFVQDLHADEDVKKAYGNDGLVLGFSAPFTDATGKVIGIWHNCANFSLVEEIVVAAYGHFKKMGHTEAELTVIDRSGRVLMDYDPSRGGGRETVQHDPGVLLKLNLAEQGVAAARDIVAGKSGHGIAVHSRKKIEQVTGYAVCDGKLGFPGLKWGVLVRVPEKQAFAAMYSEMRQIALTVALSVLALIGLGWWLSRSICRPLAAVSETLTAGAEQTAAAAGQITSASQSLAASSSEQAASLEEASASLEEMTSMVKRNAESASKAKTLAGETRAAADTGATDMREMQAAMGDIKASSDSVSKILKDIDEIAFQTNILALNAAVEAARAGDAGMGFAVVADEVRNLAHRSAKAAKDTAAKIEDATNKSQRGVEISSKVARTFHDIAGKTHEVDRYVAEIASACTEQSQGIAQIGTAVTQMDRATQSNAASAEENASASEELSAQAVALQASISSLHQMLGGGATAPVSQRPVSPLVIKPALQRPAKSSALWGAVPVAHNN